MITKIMKNNLAVLIIVFAMNIYVPIVYGLINWTIFLSGQLFAWIMSISIKGEKE